MVMTLSPMDAHFGVEVQSEEAIEARVAVQLGTVPTMLNDLS